MLDDSAPADPGETYAVSDGGEVILAASPSAASVLSYDPAGSSGTFAVENPGASVTAALENVGTGDVLELPGRTVENVTFGASTLAVTTNAGSYRFDDVSFQPAVAGYTDAVDPATNLLAITFTDVACFCPGTRIRTDRGEVPVERLTVGDRVITLAGTARRVRWIGHRHLDLTRHPVPNRARPIRIRADAFADGAPKRDLFLSPDHAVPHAGVLVPIRLLVNGASIQRDASRRRVTYYHVELDTHDILLAENLTVESYLDTGNRGLFENAGEPLMLHPDFINSPDRRVAESCAPFADDPERLEPIWRTLAARAVWLGLPLPAEVRTTDDPALCLVVDGSRHPPVSVAQGRHVFVLPASRATVRLFSRSTVQPDNAPWICDDRRLGVLIRGLTVRSGTGLLAMPLDLPSFGEGWWQPEWHSPTALRRWTNGDAVVPLPQAAPGPRLLEVEVSAVVP